MWLDICPISSSITFHVDAASRCEVNIDEHQYSGKKKNEKFPPLYAHLQKAHILPLKTPELVNYVSYFYCMLHAYSNVEFFQGFSVSHHFS